MRNRSMGWSLTFLSPWWLLLLPLIPLLGAWSLRSLSGLGKTRRMIALGLRSLVMLAVIFGLAEAQMRRVSEKMTVIYLLDQSLSIPAEQRRLMVRYVNEEIEKHRNAVRQDKAGVIVFGRDAAVEFPPYAEAVRVADTIESRIDVDATNLAGALKLAQAALPEDSAGRIVVVCDGNENMGDARRNPVAWPKRAWGSTWCRSAIRRAAKWRSKRLPSRTT
ncbi:MAG: VWA domain-containing protein [Pirellulales bacterium]